MSRLKAALTVLTALLLAPLAAAQEPTVNESDYDTAPPSGDESYLGEANASTEPSVNESDFDTSPPAQDASYLDDGSEPSLSESEFDMSSPPGDGSYLDAGAAASGADPPASRVPGPGAALAILGVMAAIVLARRR